VSPPKEPTPKKEIRIIASSGKTYVIFGKQGIGNSGSVVLSTLNGTNRFILNGEHAGDYSGRSVASAGDVNGDEIADV
jgi:hypothetical protein